MKILEGTIILLTYLIKKLKLLIISFFNVPESKETLLKLNKSFAKIGLKNLLKNIDEQNKILENKLENLKNVKLKY